MGENMMGEDWREFRAHLVAREQIEEGGIFGAISSIFSKGESSNKKELGNTATATEAKKTREDSVDIFDGSDIGGATEFSKIQVPSSCSDPFMDDEECHLIYDEPDVTLDTHRWAHPLSNVEPGCTLVANEKLGGVFHQTVVLIIDHNEATGSTGMVINRPFPGNLIKIASDTESNIDLSLKMA